MNYWLLKTEPDHDYSFDDLVRDKKTDWGGVKNYQARNNLQAMKVGDLAFIYHSGDVKAVVGVARITKESYQDPTTDDERWVAVEIEAVAPLSKSVTLADVKAEKSLAEIQLVKNSRLS
ncbi:MAG: EVE domain-containing protein, partial [Candidatus Poribacteria bacterium]|nr:EVE domain-containing protein [Candidatus Poribacteria bacterium]